MLSSTENLKKLGLFGIIVVSIVLLASQTQAAEEKTALKEKKDRVGYALGADIGQRMKEFGIIIDADMVAQGMKDAYAGKKSQLTDEEQRSTMMEFGKEVQTKQAEKMKALAEKNKTEGEAYLKENAKKKGVVTLPSGLQYTVLKEGSGKIPKNGEDVTVNYKGTLINGTEFDSSYKRNQPADFKIGTVIAGWNEALVKMKEGSKWLLVIPANLAYGERQVGPIPPNSVLIFEVELIKVKDTKAKDTKAKDKK